MATKSTNRIKATIWTPTMKMEVDGSITGVIEGLFWAVDSKAARKYLAQRLTETDAKMSQIEDEKAAAATPAQSPAQPEVPQPQSEPGR